MQAECRHYTADDREQLSTLLLENLRYHIELDPYKLREETNEFLERAWASIDAHMSDQQGVLIVAELGGAVVGFSHGYVQDTGEGFRPVSRRKTMIGYISKLYVSKEARGHGLGTRLLQKVEEDLVQKGCEFLKLSVFTANDKAKQLYQSLGYDDYRVDMLKQVV